MQPTIETRLDGITARFPDGAVISLGVSGLFPCSLCGEKPCEHFHAALPYWNRHRWEVAEREDSPWGPRLLIGIGIVPVYIVRPEYFTKHTRWAPFSTGEAVAPGVRVYPTVRGRLYRFGNEGHVYVGSDHPDGHTGCLICRCECRHVERALALEVQIARMLELEAGL